MDTTKKKLKSSCFSSAEREIIRIIGRKKMSITDVANKYFNSHHDYPLDANNYVGGVIRRIVRKCEFFNLKWSITGEGTGRSGRTVWRVSRTGGAD